jgi:dihydrofolate reductase
MSARSGGGGSRSRAGAASRRPTRRPAGGAAKRPAPRTGRAATAAVRPKAAPARRAAPSPASRTASPRARKATPPRVIYYVAASLDGFIATRGGGIDWLTPFQGAGEDYGYAAFYRSVDALVMGRKTYEQSLSFGKWPFSGKPCWIFSRQRVGATPPDVTVTAESPARVLADLAARGLGRVWLVGGGELAGAFRAKRLIDEWIVTVIPIVLGGGIPLFAPSAPVEHLQLEDARAYPNGLVQLHYQKDGVRE